MTEDSGKFKQIQKTMRVLGIILLIAVLIYSLTMKTEGISVAVKDTCLSCSHSSGDAFNIEYQDILRVTEIKNLDPGQFISGTETKRYRFGIWNNSEFGEYNLCTYADVMRFIVLETSNRTYVINLESEDATDNFYNAFREYLQNKMMKEIP